MNQIDIYPTGTVEMHLSSARRPRFDTWRWHERWAQLY